jgi:hypothetical protein
MMTPEERETVATSRMSVHQQEMSRGRTHLALQQALGGCGRLLAALWQRYVPEICHA